MERPPLRAAGRLRRDSPEKVSGMSKRSAVLVVKKSTASGPVVRNASTRAASKLLPALVAQIGARLIRTFRRCLRARASDVPGIHSHPPERAVVPPKPRLLFRRSGH